MQTSYAPIEQTAGEERQRDSLENTGSQAMKTGQPRRTSNHARSPDVRLSKPSRRVKGHT
jgi:hypothetical protein